MLDANAASPHYGEVVTSLPVGAVGTFPHHTEALVAKNNHLLANGFGAGRTWLFKKPTARSER